MFFSKAECLPTCVRCKSLIFYIETPLMHFGFFLYLPYPHTGYKNDYTSLCNVVKVQKSIIPMSNLRWRRFLYWWGHCLTTIRTIYDCKLLGGFYFICQKHFLHCFSKFIKINGLFDALKETDVFGVKTAEEVASGTYYIKSIRVILILSQNLLKLKRNAFWEKN